MSRVQRNGANEVSWMAYCFHMCEHCSRQFPAMSHDACSFVHEMHIEIIVFCTAIPVAYFVSTHSTLDECFPWRNGTDVL